MRQNGFTIIEIISAIGLFSALALLASDFILNSFRNIVAFERKRSLEIVSSSATRHILMIGRLATQCQKVMANGALQCQVDFSDPPSLTLNTVRFRPSTGVLLYEQRNPATLNWVVKTRYPGITVFDVCTDLEMAGSCAIDSIGISDRHSSGVTNQQSPSNRFFRFRIQARYNTLVSQKQSAFYIRNANPSSPYFYAWGGLE